MTKSFAGLKADALTIRNETQEAKNTAMRIGTMFTDVVDKMEADAEETSEALVSLQKEDEVIHSEVATVGARVESLEKDVKPTIHTGGVLNVTASDAGCKIDSVLSRYAVGDLVLFIIGDSNGNYPSTETRVNVNKSLCVSTNYLFSSDERGANVGDLFIACVQKVLLINRTVCRIIPLNDSKVATADYRGTEGVVTVWDKTQINKIPNIESRLSGFLLKGDRLPTIEGNESNMDECLSNGIYPWCATGRPPGSTGHYSLVVLRSSTRDFNLFYTVEQTAFGREGDTGKVFKRIIFVKDDGTKEFGDWINISLRLSDLDAVYALRGESVQTSELTKYMPITSSYAGYVAIPYASSETAGLLTTEDKQQIGKIKELEQNFEPVIVLNDVFTSVGYEPISLNAINKAQLLQRPIYVDSTELKNRCTIAYDDYTDIVYIANRVSAGIIRLSEITSGLVTNCGFYNYKTGTVVTPSQMTADEVKEIAKYYPSLQIPV